MYQGVLKSIIIGESKAKPKLRVISAFLSILLIISVTPVKAYAEDQDVLITIDAGVANTSDEESVSESIEGVDIADTVRILLSAAVTHADNISLGTNCDSEWVASHEAVPDVVPGDFQDLLIDTCSYNSGESQTVYRFVARWVSDQGEPYNGVVIRKCAVTINWNVPDPEPQQPVQSEPEPQPEPEQEPQVQDGDQGENANVETPIDEAQKLLQSQIILLLSRKQDVINSLKNKGVTLDIGTWESLNKESYEKIDILLGNGIPVTIKYRYNNQYREITIPATLKYKLADLCDANGYLGLENLRGKLIADGYIKVETNDDEEMNIEIIDGIPMPVPKDPPKYEMKKLDIDGQVPSFDRLIGSQNNSNALPGTASLSAAGTTAATSPATSISSDTGSNSIQNFAIAPANVEEWDDSVHLAIAVGIEKAKASNTDYTIYVASDGKLLTLTIKADSLKNWKFNSNKLRDEVDKMVSEKKSITI